MSSPSTFKGSATAGLTASLLYASLSCSLPSGLSRRERQLAGYTKTLRKTVPEHLRLSVGPVPGSELAGYTKTFPEHLRLSVGPVPAGARLASYVRANSIVPPAGTGPAESEISC